MTEEQSSPATDFLLAEYQAISQEFHRHRNEGISRLNFFITLTSLFGGGLLLLNEVGSPSPTSIQLISLGALAFLIVIGWYTFSFTISRDSSADHTVRTQARIRRYFADQYPTIKPYLTWPESDEPTPYVFKNKSGIRQTAQTILTLLCSLAVSITLNLIFRQMLLSLGSGILAFGGIFMILRAYAQRKFRAAYQKAEQAVRFPQTAPIPTVTQPVATLASKPAEELTHDQPDPAPTQP